MSHRIRWNLHTLLCKGMQISVKQYGWQLNYTYPKVQGNFHCLLGRCLIVMHSDYWKLIYPCATSIIIVFWGEPNLKHCIFPGHFQFLVSEPMYQLNCLACARPHNNFMLHRYINSLGVKVTRAYQGKTKIAWSMLILRGNVQNFQAI